MNADLVEVMCIVSALAGVIIGFLLAAFVYTHPIKG